MKGAPKEQSSYLVLVLELYARVSCKYVSIIRLYPHTAGLLVVFHEYHSTYSTKGRTLAPKYLLQTHGRTKNNLARSRAWHIREYFEYIYTALFRVLQILCIHESSHSVLFYNM